MTRTIVAALLAGAAPILAENGGSYAKPTWREAFQVSPAAYAPPSEELIKATAARLKIPAETIEAAMRADARRIASSRCRHAVERSTIHSTQF